MITQLFVLNTAILLVSLRATTRQFLEGENASAEGLTPNVVGILKFLGPLVI